MDWFYIAERLGRGGIVLADDTWIWTCDVLARFLAALATMRSPSNFRGLSQRAERCAARGVG
jgi:hypothetical protein